MLVKIAKKIVDGMAQGLTGTDLDAACGQAVINAQLDPATYEKDFEAIRNEYVQHQWDVEDLTGEPEAKKPAAKAKKPAAKAKKPAAKDAPKVNEAGKRIGKDGQVIVAYPKPQGRTAVMFALVLAGASNADGLAYIKKEFRGCPTTISSLGWVRSQLRNNPSRWANKYGSTSKLIKGVKADKDCGKLDAKIFDAVVEAQQATDEDGEE